MPPGVGPLHQDGRPRTWTAILDAVKRIAGFPVELRLQRVEQAAELVRAQAQVLDAEGELAEARARRRRRDLLAAGWEIDRAVLSDDDDAVL